MNLKMPMGSLLSAIDWLNERGYYDEAQYKDDCWRATMKIEDYGVGQMMTVDFASMPNVTEEDKLLFKLTFGGQ